MIRDYQNFNKDYYTNETRGIQFNATSSLTHKYDAVHN